MSFKVTFDDATIMRITYPRGGLLPKVIEVDPRDGGGTPSYVPERECHNIAEPPESGFWPTPHFECSACGHCHVSLSYVYFCPSCGAKVEM